MQIARKLTPALVALMLSCACDGSSSDEIRYRSARQKRSALSLLRYLQDDFGNEHNDEARALIAKHYDFAMEQVPGASVSRRLLEALAEIQDPRVLARIASPQLDPTLNEEARSYFGAAHPWTYYFASGASRAAEKRFPHGTVTFEHEESFDFEPGERTPVLEASWSIAHSDQLFSGPPSLSNLGQPPAALRGIEIEMTLRLHLPGEAEALSATVRGRPGEGFSYRSFMGLPARDDLYEGMVEAAMAEALLEFFPAPPLEQARE